MRSSARIVFITAGAEFGKALHQQMQLAVEDINGAGGVNGKKLEILLEDSKCDASAAENAALKLATDTQVIIGGTCISNRKSRQCGCGSRKKRSYSH